jgi:hypothetical protein
MDLVQIDHTWMDVVVVDREWRLPIGRPWLTLAIDVASRAVAGFSVSLEAPWALSVSLVLSHMRSCPKRLGSPTGNSRISIGRWVGCRE